VGTPVPEEIASVARVPLSTAASVVSMFGDNKSAIAMAINNSSHQSTRHVRLRHHFIREQVEDGSVQLQWVPTARQLADVLTKALHGQAFAQWRDRLVSPPAVQQQQQQQVVQQQQQ